MTHGGYEITTFKSIHTFFETRTLIAPRTSKKDDECEAKWDYCFHRSTSSKNYYNRGADGGG